MPRYTIPSRTISLTTLPGAFIILFMLLALPFFIAHELGKEWVDENLAAILAAVALPSLAGALWIARWVERKQSEEWVEIDESGVTSTMRTHPRSQGPATIDRSREGQKAFMRFRDNRQSLLWLEVRSVELHARHSVHTPGTHYQVRLITDRTVLPIPLNDDVLGTRSMVEVDFRGRPLGGRVGGRYPGVEIVREVHGRVGHLPWRVIEEHVGKYECTERELAFTGIEDPWSGEPIGGPDTGILQRRRTLLFIALAAVLVAALIFGFVYLQTSRMKAEREEAEALRRALSETEMKAPEKSAPENRKASEGESQ